MMKDEINLQQIDDLKDKIKVMSEQLKFKEI